MKLLEIKNLEAWYGKIQVLHKVNLVAEKNKMTCIIGPNGAGKSSVLKSIFSQVTMKHGRILFEDMDVTNKKPEELVRLGISYVQQGKPIFPRLTVKENLELGAYTKEKCEKELQFIYSKFPILKHRENQKAGYLSGGEQQMLAIGRALMSEPKLLILDEPSAGLSPKIKLQIFDKLDEIKKIGVTILIVEQNARMALEYSDYAYVLETGNNVLEGHGNKLLKDNRVQHLYLGH